MNCTADRNDVGGRLAGNRFQIEPAPRQNANSDSTIVRSAVQACFFPRGTASFSRGFEPLMRRLEEGDDGQWRANLWAHSIRAGSEPMVSGTARPKHVMILGGLMRSYESLHFREQRRCFLCRLAAF